MNGTEAPTPSPYAEDSSSSNASQIVLICLTVLFGCLFLFMVFKYHRLRTTIGDYRVAPGARGGASQQTYDNPAFSGFGLGDSYRER